MIMSCSSPDKDARHTRVLAAIGQDSFLERHLSAALFTWSSSNQTRALRDPPFNLEASECSEPERGRSLPPHNLPADATITTRHRHIELLFFISEHQHLGRDPPNTQMDREASAMRDVEARLQTIQTILTQNRPRIDIEEIVSLVEAIFFYRTDNSTKNFLMRCPFHKNAFQCRFSVSDAASRVNRLRHVRSLPAGSTRSTLIACVSFDNTEATADRAARLIVGADTATDRRVSSIKDKLSLFECLAVSNHEMPLPSGNQQCDIVKAVSSDLNINTALIFELCAILALYLSTTSQDIHSNMVARFHGTGKLIFVIIDFKNCRSIGSVNGSLSDNELFL